MFVELASDVRCSTALGSPVPIGKSSLPSHRLLGSDLFVPAVADQQCSQLQHAFGTGFTPKNRIAFQALIDHATNAAFNRPTTQRQSKASKMGIAHPTGFAMLGEVVDFALHGADMVNAFIQQFLKFFHYATPLTVAKQRSVLTIERHPLPFVEPVFLQGQRDMMSRMTAIENFVNRHLRTDTGGHNDPSHAVPNPRCSIAGKRNAQSFPGTQPMQVQGDQFCRRIGPLKRTVDRRAGFGHHPALRIVFKDRQRLGLTPRSVERTLDAATGPARRVFDPRRLPAIVHGKTLA